MFFQAGAGASDLEPVVTLAVKEEKAPLAEGLLRH